jgi:hypothetical protein
VEPSLLRVFRKAASIKSQLPFKIVPDVSIEVTSESVGDFAIYFFFRFFFKKLP